MKTVDHDEIRRWVEERGGKPACVKGTGRDGDLGILRIDFPGYGEDENLQHVGWEEWFDAFEDNGLAMLVQAESDDGKVSRFNKLIAREAEDEAKPKPRTGRQRSSAR